MPKRPTQLNREIDEALFRQKGQRAYSQVHARVGDSSDDRLGSEAAHLAAIKASDRPGEQAAFAKGWLDEREAHLRQREQYRQQRPPEEAVFRRQDSEAYRDMHTRVGNSTDTRLGPSGARRAAKKVSSRPDDQEAFMRGWLEEREQHLLEHSQYGRRPYVPLTFPEFPLPGKD